MMSIGMTRGRQFGGLYKAERGGFEPPVPFLRHSISSAAQSATLPSLRSEYRSPILDLIPGCPFGFGFPRILR